jgi:hypothetical protein
MSSGKDHTGPLFDLGIVPRRFVNPSGLRMAIVAGGGIRTETEYFGPGPSELLEVTGARRIGFEGCRPNWMLIND